MIFFQRAPISLSAVEVTKKTLIYVPDNFSSIQEAVDSAPPFSKIIVRKGNYFENIRINKEVSIISEVGPNLTKITYLDPEVPVVEILSNYVNFSGFTLVGCHAMRAVITVKASNVAIINNIILNGTDGLDLMDSRKTDIRKNLILKNRLSGIFLIDSHENSIKDNIVENNFEGIILAYSSYNEIINNTINNNYRYGILLEMSSKNFLSKNLIFKSERNFGIYGILVENFINFLQLDNEINNKRIIYLANKTNLTILANVGFVGLINSTNIVVRDLNLSNNFQSLLIVSSSNIVLTNLTVSNNWYGVYIVNSNNITIFFNDFINNTLNIYSYNSTVFVRSRNKINYEYRGKIYSNYLGNYWSDYVTNNSIGGIAVKPYVEIYIKDDYPLVSSHYEYKILEVSKSQVNLTIVGILLIIAMFLVLILLKKLKNNKFLIKKQMVLKVLRQRLKYFR
ncbi:MAG: right-handed parallel beta-helix repeat-containing protein [Candidatus Brockarchaeota archaeon]|nr:right-handed parallel beta-helix repeat-containing protein [Candidatus Brockarchaeota archaeon]MBO3767965.1 right-handed parallel beta-helix repeat-containing protein [Candidatus Brockarchaeota archaeon]MBO3802032.1 right-handed parallel beta-helix repeat-containing protein [Candidatus Brockarchaeota archaeon]